MWTFILYSNYFVFPWFYLFKCCFLIFKVITCLSDVLWVEYFFFDGYLLIILSYRYCFALIVELFTISAYWRWLARWKYIYWCRNSVFGVNFKLLLLFLLLYRLVTNIYKVSYFVNKFGEFLMDIISTYVCRCRHKWWSFFNKVFRSKTATTARS